MNESHIARIAAELNIVPRQFAATARLIGTVIMGSRP
jgi:hypothetical protein